MSKHEQEGLSKKPAHQSCLSFLPAIFNVSGKVSESEEVSQNEFEFGSLPCNTLDVSAGGKDSQDGIEFHVIL